MECLLEKLRDIEEPIFVNNDKDYNFLIKMKEYYNLKFDVFSDNIFLLVGSSYHKFNYDEGLTYDQKINKCIFLIDTLEEIGLSSSDFFYI